MSYEEMDEYAVKAQNGDQEAFKLLVKEFDPMCVKLAKHYHSWILDFDDVLQLTRIELWNAVKRFDRHRGCFFQFCRATIVNHLRSMMFRTYSSKWVEFLNGQLRLDKEIENKDGDLMPFIEKAVTTTTMKSMTESIVARRYGLNLFHEIMQHIGLSDLELKCLDLYFNEDKTYKEISEMFGFKDNVKPVDNALQRAKKKIANNRELFEVYQLLA